MNMVIEVDKYQVIHNGDVVSEWYSEECARDYINELCPDGLINVTYCWVPQPCDQDKHIEKGEEAN